MTFSTNMHKIEQIIFVESQDCS